MDEIESVLTAGEIIEDENERGRCLLCGRVTSGGLVHVVVDYSDWLNDPDASLVVVTVYRPDPARWIDGRIRRT